MSKTFEYIISKKTKFNTSSNADIFISFFFQYEKMYTEETSNLKTQCLQTQKIFTFKQPLKIASKTQEQNWS